MFNKWLKNRYIELQSEFNPLKGYKTCENCGALCLKHLMIEIPVEAKCCYNSVQPEYYCKNCKPKFNLIRLDFDHNRTYLTVKIQETEVGSR